MKWLQPALRTATLASRTPRHELFSASRRLHRPLLNSSPARLRPIAAAVSSRCASTTAATPVPTSSQTSRPTPAAHPYRPAPHRNPEEPVYELTFTCKACKTRSAHTVSKQGYHKGTVLIACPGCKSRHLISDHLHVFSDKAVTLEDILQSKGETLTKGTIGPQEDLEFWSQDAVPDSERSK